MDSLRRTALPPDNELSFEVKDFKIKLFRYGGKYHIGIISPTGDTWQVTCESRNQAQDIFYKEMEAVQRGEYEFPRA